MCKRSLDIFGLLKLRRFSALSPRSCAMEGIRSVFGVQFSVINFQTRKLRRQISSFPAKSAERNDGADVRQYIIFTLLLTRSAVFRSVGNSRQREKERGPFVHLAFGPSPAGMALDNTPDIGQPKTCSFKFIPVVQPLEKAEKFLGLAHVEAGS